MKFIGLLINSNVYISLAAVLLTIETQIQLGIKPQWHPYLFIIFFAALVEYNLHRLITVLTNKEALNSRKHSWVKKNPGGFYMLVGISVIGFLIAVFMAQVEILIVLAPVAFLTMLYSLPQVKNSKYIFRLREVPFLKIFLIAFVWSSATILLPFIQSGNFHNREDIILILIERFIFIFAITIPFDIRDIEADKKAGLKTIPVLFGHEKSLMISVSLVIVFMIISVFHYSRHDKIFILIAFILSGISTMYFLNSKKLQKFTYYHYFIIDGTMLLQGLLVLAFYYITSG